jgi:hypothetical protein
MTSPGRRAPRRASDRRTEAATIAQHSAGGQDTPADCARAGQPASR